jgi:phosphoribosylformimino-5-aminoimidazole carboxamide ribotide isomerase
MGTRACEDDVFIHRIISEFGERIVVSIDAKDQMVATEGWKKVSDVNVVDFIKKLEFFGLKVMIYTDIAKDGTLEGPNIKAVKEILSARESIMVISSGGVSTVEDLARLKELEPQGLLGVIVGKALYEKKINLKEAIERC